MDSTRCVHTYETGFKSLLGCVKIPRLTPAFCVISPGILTHPNSFHDQCKVRGIPFSIPQASILIYIFHDRRKTAAGNVIIFGETGVGKSSIINMLPGGRVAAVNGDAKGVTFRHERYVKDIGGCRLDIFDTVGLNEGAAGTVSAPQAIEGLYRLMRGLDDGVSLLVYVVRGPRLKNSARKNYEMFYEIFCEKKVPIVLVITGLEHEDDMDEWWKRNEAAFSEEGMRFCGAACITATKGKRNLLAKEFEESREKVEKLILDHCPETPWLPPTGGGASWHRRFLLNNVNRLAKPFHFKAKVFAKSIYQALRSYGEMDDEEARNLANRIYLDSRA
ncbi:uncharacterized protein LACBIDRAFT_329003 [Laccaria bicolor S238N-H82]|uniref:Predicted protein n=1 Tax=Laccaria bicolor (strain S238N-H82 / ATCC MYA-4686) TaxID=486041 RepID=B0DGR1_LACBS|nr:uncharacterized protein LACBIDRAFT_329003 [Laccaria bicolor S238N-H82]EDR06314.1 predicted protein [Laccaria bicolor S238N-H82]|eukprot:XP_001883175.1 predicted protein [Laccaria bicolor S238N-H82]